MAKRRSDFVHLLTSLKHEETTLGAHKKHENTTDLERSYPAGIYLLKVSNRNTRARCEICSKLTANTPERCQWQKHQQKHKIVVLLDDLIVKAY